MIKATFTAKGNLLENLVAYTESFQQQVDKTLDAVVTEVQPTLKDELGYVPPPRNPEAELNWTSPAQMKAFFASNGFGGGIPHKRTNAMPDGWIVEVRDGKLFIANPVPGSVFVYGSLARKNPGKFQQKFLRDIGWQPAYETVFYWTDAIFTEVSERIDAQFKGLGSVSSQQKTFTYTGRGRNWGR